MYFFNKEYNLFDLGFLEKNAIFGVFSGQF